jgi:hypothetical protein
MISVKSSIENHSIEILDNYNNNINNNNKMELYYYSSSDDDSNEISLDDYYKTIQNSINLK